MKDTYTGFETGEDRQLYLDCRLKDGDGEGIAYSYIVRLRYKSDKQFHLIGTDFTITFTGRNLGTLIDALFHEAVCFIQEFNFKHFHKPADDAPLIEMIKISSEGQDDI